MAQSDVIAPDVDAAAPPPLASDDVVKPAADAAPTADAAGDDILDKSAAADAETKPVTDVLADADDGDEEGTPDSYTFDLPEDLAEKGVKLDEDTIEAFKAAAKDIKLTQEQFDAVVRYDLERSQNATDTAVKFWTDRVQSWRDSAKTDKEFGGEHYEANVQTAQKAIAKFGDADLKAIMQSPSEANPEGLAIGNHPAMLRFLNRIGRVIGDPSLILGDDVQKGDATEAKLRNMYPSMYPDKK